MKTIQVIIDEELLAKVDEVVQAKGTNRSAFIREALAEALRRYRIAQMEKQDAASYARHPAEPVEFQIWESEQAWGDEE